ncbi:MAG: hypothetical protein IT462_08520 [Planctomycetes bacterium]|nr:hypothetical protein [Planctomycetota bacterium]
MALIQINKNPSDRELRSFAWLWFPLFCAALSLIVWWRTKTLAVAYVMAVAAVIVAVLGVVKLRAVKYVFVGLMYVTFPVGFVMSHLLLGLIYYGFFTPIGFGMRLFGWDAMSRRIEKDKPSYWVELPPPPAKDSYFRQS